MTDTLHAMVWLTDENFERCTAERTEVLRYYTERRRVSGFHPLLGNKSYNEEVTHLWTTEEIPFDVPAGARVSHVMVQIGDLKIPNMLECGVTDFPSAGVFNVWPLNMEVREKLDD